LGTLDASHEVELLAIQAEASLDGSGRVTGLYGITIACAGERRIAWIGAQVPDDLAAELRAVLAEKGPSRRVDAPPPELKECRRLLAAGGRSVVGRAGLVFMIPGDTRFRSAAHIERSDAPPGEVVRNGNPGNWHPVEWEELLEGRLGPWTIALEGELVVSICHTPRRMTARGAECGVWTRPGFRGRGYAAAVASEWAEMMRPSGRHLFYACDADNLSSQQVARRLNLRPVGRTWDLALARDGDDSALHPLSALRRGL
jgi:RimJ/RimL family protein N-acetyltransferase